MSSFMTPRRPSGAQQAKRPSLSGNGNVTRSARSNSSQFRSKFAVSYESLLSGEQPWLGSVAGPSGSGSIAGTPLQTGSSSPSASSVISSPPVSYFSSSGKKNSAPRSRFFADLLCLKVEPGTLAQLLDRVHPAALSQDAAGTAGAQIRDNIGSLWRECLRIWSDTATRQPEFGNSTSPQGISSPHNVSPTSPRDLFSQSADGNGKTFGNTRQDTDEVRRANAVETLVLLSRAILAKKASSSSVSSLDLIWIFAGGIDEADEIFESLVNAIDDGLRGHLDVPRQHRSRAASRAANSYFPSTPTRQTPTIQTTAPAALPTLGELLLHRRQALHLAITWISYISASNLSAYFVRRDLFVAACNLLAYLQSLMSTAQAREGAQGLAQEDLKLAHETVRDVTLLIGLLAGLGQGGLASSVSSTSSYHGNLESSFSPYFRRLCDWVDHPALLRIRDVLAHELETTWRAYESSEVIASPSLSSRLTAPLEAVTEGLRKFNVAEAPASLDARLPSPAAASLLPLFLLIRANQVFVELAMRPPAAGQGSDVSSFAASLFSASSYLVTHGSLNHRARVYSRLTLLVFLTLLSSNAGTTELLSPQREAELANITECKQRAAPLPVSAGSDAGGFGGLGNYLPRWANLGSQASLATPTGRQRLLPSLLDSCVQYLRHNLRKKLDSSGYLLCLHVIQLAIQRCAQKRVQLEYNDWPEVWRSLISLAAFLTARHTELQGVEIKKLGPALIGTISTALVDSDRFLSSKKDTDALVYELVRSADVLRRLATLSAAGTVSANASPRLNGDSTRAPSKASIANAVPSWRMLDVLFGAFDDKLRAWHEKRGEGGMLGISFSLGGYFGSTGSDSKSSSQEIVASAADSNKEHSNASSRPSSSSGTSSQKAMPGVQTVYTLVESLDLEQLIQRGRVEHRNGAAGGLIDEAWIENAETQCLAEAFRVAAEDIRALIADV